MAHRHNHVNEKKKWEAERAAAAKQIDELKRTVQSLTNDKAELQRKMNSLNAIFEAVVTSHSTMATEKEEAENENKSLKKVERELQADLETIKSLLLKISCFAQGLVLDPSPIAQIISVEMLKMFQETAENVQTPSDLVENAEIPEENHYLSINTAQLLRSIRESQNLPGDGRMSPETVQKHLEIVQKAQKMMENGENPLSLYENCEKLAEEQNNAHQLEDMIRKAYNQFALPKNFYLEMAKYGPLKPAPESTESTENASKHALEPKNLSKSTENAPESTDSPESAPEQAPEVKNPEKSTENAPNQQKIAQEPEKSAEKAPERLFLARNLNWRKTDHKKLIQLEPYKEPEDTEVQNGENLAQDAPEAQHGPILAENGSISTQKAENTSRMALEAQHGPILAENGLNSSQKAENTSKMALEAQHGSILAENGSNSSQKAENPSILAPDAQNGPISAENGSKSPSEAEECPHYVTLEELRERVLDVCNESELRVKPEIQEELLYVLDSPEFHRIFEEWSRISYRNFPNIAENGSNLGPEVLGARIGQFLAESALKLSQDAENPSKIAPNAPKSSREMPGALESILDALVADFPPESDKNGPGAENPAQNAPKSLPQAADASNFAEIGLKVVQERLKSFKSAENGSKSVTRGSAPQNAAKSSSEARNAQRAAQIARKTAPNAKNPSKVAVNAPKSVESVSQAQNAPKTARKAPEAQNARNSSENGSKATQNAPKSAPKAKNAPNPSEPVINVAQSVENSQNLVRMALETSQKAEISPVVIAEFGHTENVSEEQLLAGLAKIVAQNKAPRTQKPATPPPDFEIDSEDERDIAEAMPVLKQYGLDWFKDVTHPTGEDLKRLLTTVIQVNRLRGVNEKDPKPASNPQRHAACRQYLRDSWKAELLDCLGSSDSDSDAPEPSERASTMQNPPNSPKTGRYSSKLAENAPGTSKSAPNAPGPSKSSSSAKNPSKTAKNPPKTVSEPQIPPKIALEPADLAKITEREQNMEMLRYFEEKRLEALAEREAAGLPPRSPIEDAPWHKLLDENPRPSPSCQCCHHPSPAAQNGSTSFKRGRGRRLPASNPLDAILDNPGPTRRSPGPSGPSKSATGPSASSKSAPGPQNAPKSAPEPIEAYVVSHNAHCGFKLPLESAISAQKMVETIENGRKPSPNPEILKGFDKIKRELFAMLNTYENEWNLAKTAKLALILVKNPSKLGENGENFTKLTQNSTVSAQNPAKWGQSSQKIDGYEMKEEKNGKTVKMLTMDGFSATLALKDAKEAIERRKSWVAAKSQESHRNCHKNGGFVPPVPDWLLGARDAQAAGNSVPVKIKASIEADIKTMSKKFAKEVMERERESEQRYQKAKNDFVGLFEPRENGPSTSSAPPRNIDEWEKIHADKLKFDPSKYKDDKDNEKLFEECLGKYFRKARSAPKKDNVALGLGSSKDYAVEKDEEEEQGPSGSA